ncbi:Tyrosine-protein kinase transforming protein ros-like [Homarus americanus]|uniref:receptor protein-tyrosine kinase n=1 Tax=Homarus americanus TaxID=6706 RepID=A0A8J5JHW1_HOMAM|nr:Tyrosine-protein kinase transforming protein ros-like [Homarus americanus]
MQEQRTQRRCIETKGFLEFFNQKLQITGCKTDVILRDDLYHKYKMYCKCRGLMPATIVNVGRTLAKKGVKSPSRIGGINGKGQKYGYTGIVFQPCMEVVPWHPYSAVYSMHSDSVISGKRKLEEQDQNEPKRAKITGKIIDPISTFLESFVSTSLDHKELVRQNDLFNEYREYCRQNGLEEYNNIKLGRLMTARGFKPTVREGLGYQNVTISHYEEDSFNLTKALERLNATGRNGNTPTAMINLEVWQPPSSREEDRIARSDCGSHSSGSRFGWYVSNNSYTQTNVITDHWRSFQQEAVTKLFELTPDEEERLKELTKSPTGYYCDASFCTEGIYTPPRCEDGRHCATLFVGSFNTYTHFLKKQVDEEQLLVRIAWIGPNLDPHFLCTFRESKPISIRRFYLRQEDYQELLSMYEDRIGTCSNNTTLLAQPNNQIMEEIACEWLQRNHSDDTVVWKNWLSHDYYAKTILWIAGIFPMSSEKNIGFSSHTLVNAAELAYHNVNSNDNVLQDFEIDVLNQNGGCKSEDVLTAFIRYVRRDSSHLTFEQMIGVLGPACSETVEPLAGVAQTFNTIVLSYSAEGAIFNDQEKYPNFLRTIPENKLYGTVYFKLFKKFGWKKVATLTEDSNKYSAYLNLLRNRLPTSMDLENRNIHKNVNRNMTDHLVKLKAKNRKIIIGDFYASTAREVMCEAYRQNMTAYQDYVWFLPRWYENMVPDQSTWPLGDLMSLNEWELPREKVVINRTIGEGAFGTVFGGECQFGDNTPWLAVAVKTLKVGSTVEEKLDFLGEAEMMKRFNHKNIVQLLGLCTHQEPIYMIMEFLLYGDLKTYLLARRHLVSDRSLHTEEDEISSKRLTSMALDVCRALAYLTELRYVHRDVACRNCLVSAERVVKLSDFGMTRPMYESDYYRFNRRAMLPVRWMSPESLEDGMFTNMSDMWSYGVLLYEIITFGSFPFQGMSNNQVLDHVRAGNTISIPKGVRPQLERLLLSTWSMNPHDRPTFNEMMDTLTMWPRLITPCLEVPTAAVQLNDTDSLELVLPADQTCRRSSAPNARLPNARVRHTSGSENCPGTNAVQLNNFSHVPNTSILTNNSILSTPSSLNPPATFNSHNWNRAPQENGGGPSVEPLLPQNGDGYVTRYVCLQRTKSGENSNDLDSPTNMTSV